MPEMGTNEQKNTKRLRDRTQIRESFHAQTDFELRFIQLFVYCVGFSVELLFLSLCSLCR
jgi:hypothetical protein